MKPHLLDRLVCPQDHGQLEAKNLVLSEDQSEWMEGDLVCVNCSKSYPIKAGVPRFVPEDHYTQSFGFQWNKFDKTQLDSYSGLSISKDRFDSVCDWKLPKEGWGLEVGCGAGRFTEVAADLGMDWVAVDPSIAIEANYRNNGHRDKVHLVQADLYHLPFKKQSFDKVICLGVLQHTPDPKASFDKVIEQLKGEGAEMAIDVYTKRWDNIFWSKYWLRLFTRRIEQSRLLLMITKWAPFLIRCHDVLRLIPFIGRYLAYRLVPICNYKYTYPLNKQQNLEWAILDTFDMLSPEYDIPKSVSDVEAWFGENPHKNFKVGYGPNGVIARMER